MWWVRSTAAATKCCRNSRRRATEFELDWAAPNQAIADKLGKTARTKRTPRANLSPPRNIRAPSLGNHRVRLVGVDAQVLDRFIENCALDLSIHEKFMKRRHRNEAGIDLEEIAQRRTPFASAKAIRPQRSQPPRHPLADHI